MPNRKAKHVCVKGLHWKKITNVKNNPIKYTALLLLFVVQSTSPARVFLTPWTAACQASSLLLLLLLLLSRFSRVRLWDPIDGSPPGSPGPGILQARKLDWVAISFSNAWKWKVKVKSLSRVWLFATPWTAAYQAPPPMGFSRQEDWSGVAIAFLSLTKSWSPEYYYAINKINSSGVCMCIFRFMNVRLNSPS